MTELSPVLRRPSALAALRVPAYRWWFASQVLSASGNMAQAVGLAWLVLGLGGNGIDLGLLGAATFGPVLVIGPWAGALLDRTDHRRVLIATQVLFLSGSAILAALTAAGAVSLWSVFTLALLSGVVFAVDSPARQVYVLELVGPERTASAVGLFEVIVNASRVLGPAVGGVLIATVGVSSCFAVNAASFLPPLAALLAFTPAYPPEREPAGRGLAAIAEGLRYVAASPALVATLVMAVASGMLFNLGVALPVLATHVFHVGSTGYGGLMAAFGLGAIPGALAAGRNEGPPDGRRVRGLCALTGVAVLLTAAAPTALVAFAGLAVTGFVSIWFIALANTLVQLRTATRLRGRVLSLWSMALPGMNPVTGLLAGAATQLAGARVGFGLAGVGLLAAAAAGWRALAA